MNAKLDTSNKIVRTLDLLSLKRNSIFEAIGVLTGHWLFGKHGNRLVSQLVTHVDPVVTVTKGKPLNILCVLVRLLRRYVLKH